MKINKELIKRDIAGDTILVPVGRTVYESNGLFILNELGAFVWDLLPDAQSEEELIRAVLEEYEVSEADAARDIHAFLGQLRELKIL